MSSRRFPIYLLLDTSESMNGESLELIRQGVKLLVSELKNDPFALETTYLSVITFGGTARQVVPLTELALFQEPTIDAGGSSAMGAALEELINCADRELVKWTADRKGDYRPLVFLMTNGRPTDRWEQAADNVKAKQWNIVACAAGSGSDEFLLKRITKSVVKLNDCQPGTLSSCCRFIFQDVPLMSPESKRLVDNPPQPLPLPPPGTVIVDAEGMRITKELDVQFMGCGESAFLCTRPR